MPLIGGKAGIGPNIRELAINSKTGEKRPMAQRVAIALDTARRTGAEIPAPRYGGKHLGAIGRIRGPKRYGGL